jgi:hypothetical protein
MPAAKYKIKDRVKCLATRFDAEGLEDAQGRKWSEVHILREKTKWVCGTVIKKMGGKKFNGNYKVKYDGDASQSTSNESHIFKAPPMGEELDDSEEESDSGSSGSEEEGTKPSSAEDKAVDDNGDNALSDEERDAEGMMERPEGDDEDLGEPDQVNFELEDLPIGGSVDVGGNVWKRVATMGEDPRGDRPKSTMTMKKMLVNSHTTRSDFWKELFPVPLEEAVAIVTANAVKHRDRGVFNMDGFMKFLCCLYGGCQFAVGTDVWATKQKGMMPPPNFGRILSSDKFDRWKRYLSEGPADARASDPWREVRWLVDGYNANRKATVTASWLVVVDETMWAWTGQGMPHLSFVKRKPEPLGAEVKNLCDGLSGVMLYLELQEGKTRMAAKKYCDEYKATTATTLRLADFAGLGEQHLREEDKVQRLLVGDSWFAGYATAKALMDELGVHFVGNVKTAHRGYPIDQLRWDLSKTQRGDHVVYKLEGEEHMYAVGWNDHHFKTFVATGGTSAAGITAKRKRQTDTGQTFYKEVKRPKVMQDYYEACGQIDLHNNFRQGQLRLEKFFRTHKWHTRVMTSILSSSMVDAFRAWEHHFPPSEEDRLEGDTGSRLKTFVARVIEEIMPNDNNDEPEDVEESECQLELIGKRRGKTGKTKGKMLTKQLRCNMCRKSGRKGKDGKSTRSGYRCKAHPDVTLCAEHAGPCLMEHREEHGEI